MRRLIFLGAAGVILAVAVAVWWNSSSSPESLFEPQVRPPESAPLCPWREPASDLNQFFPHASDYEVETRILSGLRLELTQRLGRVPTGEENALHAWRIRQGKTTVGTVLTRRVKGEYGAIEIVLAVDSEGRVIGLRLQRLREPEAITRALQNPDWLRSFAGKREDSSWNLAGDILEVAPEARTSAQAVIEGARSLLILLAASDQAVPSSKLAATPHH